MLLDKERVKNPKFLRTSYMEAPCDASKLLHGWRAAGSRFGWRRDQHRCGVLFLCHETHDDGHKIYELRVFVCDAMPANVNSIPTDDDDVSIPKTTSSTSRRCRISGTEHIPPPIISHTGHTSIYTGFVLHFHMIKFFQKYFVLLGLSNATYQYSRLVFGYPPPPFQCGRHLSIAP